MAARACVSIAAISVALCARALAQSPAAEALFNDGQKQLDAGNIAQACESFAAANRIEPRAGTLIALGECRELLQQFASAWSAYKNAVARAKDPKKLAFAQERVAALEPQLSYLKIVVGDASRIEGLSITRNGATVDPALWNRAEPIDGGEYTIAASAINYRPWQTKVSVPATGGQIAVEIPGLEALPIEQQPSPRQPEGPEQLWSTKRRLAVGLAGVGVATLATGIAIGVIAKDKERTAYDLCPDPNVMCADAQRSTDLVTTGHRFAIIANVMFGVAGAAAIGGAVLWFTGAPARSGIALVPNAQGVSVVGRF